MAPARGVSGTGEGGASDGVVASTAESLAILIEHASIRHACRLPATSTDVGTSRKSTLSFPVTCRLAHSCANQPAWMRSHSA